MKDGINRKNLQKLATFLAYGELPKEVKFDMSQFTDLDVHPDGMGTAFCQTAGCAVGFAPFAGIRKFKTETFGRYSERALIADEDSSEWHWCFSGAWDEIDKTPKGAAKRIQHLLDGNRIPFLSWTTSPTTTHKKLYAKVKVKK